MTKSSYQSSLNNYKILHSKLEFLTSIVVSLSSTTLDSLDISFRDSLFSSFRDRLNSSLYDRIQESHSDLIKSKILNEK